MKSLFSLTIVLFLFPVTAAVFASPSEGDGMQLYRKHCGGCHPDTVSLKTSKNLVSLMRRPPVPMPAFEAERLSDKNAHVIDDFIRESRKTGKSSQPAAAPLPTVPADLSSASTAAEANTAGISPDQPKKSSEPPRPLRRTKPGPRRFIKSWTIKCLRNGESATLQNFEIVANARNELSVVPSVSLVDYAVKVRAFEISDNRMKLELTWSWKNNPLYWKIETYQLTLSEDGKKLAGTYTMDASSGQSATWSVWGE